MAPRSKGVGRGTGSGGKRPGAGRPKGAINKRATALIEEAERSGQLLPVDYLLSVMRNPEAEERNRMAAAAMAAPYCHARLTALAAFSNPNHLDDLALTTQFSRLEQRIDASPASDDAARGRSIIDQVETLLQDLDHLPFKQRQRLARRLVAAGEASLRELHDPDRPGAVPPRGAMGAGSPPQPGNPEAAPISRPTRSASEQAPAAAPGPPNGTTRLRYNPISGELEPA